MNNEYDCCDQCDYCDNYGYNYDHDHGYDYYYCYYLSDDGGRSTQVPFLVVLFVSRMLQRRIPLALA